MQALTDTGAIAQCFIDLAENYQRQYSLNDEFIKQCIDAALLFNPHNISVKLLKVKLAKATYQATSDSTHFEH